MDMQIDITEINWRDGRKGSYYVAVGDRWSPKETLLYDVTLEQALNAASIYINEIKEKATDVA